MLLTVAGDHVPVTELSETVDNTGAIFPEQIEDDNVNDGVIVEVKILTVVVVVEAHCPPAGVNVYVPVAVLLTVAGDQVPVIALLEDVDNTGAVAPEQIDVATVKVGVVGKFTA